METNQVMPSGSVSINEAYTWYSFLHYRQRAGIHFQNWTQFYFYTGPTSQISSDLLYADYQKFLKDVEAKDTRALEFLQEFVTWKMLR